MKQKGWTGLGTKAFKIENLDSHCQRLKLDTPESPKSHAECGVFTLLRSNYSQEESIIFEDCSSQPD